MRNPRGSLHSAWRKARRLAGLQTLVDRIAPGTLVANYDAGRLVLHATNAAEATRLRYDTRRLGRQLMRHDAFTDLETIDIRVRPINAPPVAPADPTRHLAPSARAGLVAAADDVSDDDLRNALLSLSRAPDDDRD